MLLFKAHNITSHAFLFSRNAEKTHTDQSIQHFFFTLSKIKHSQTFKKFFSPLCMLLVQLASMNILYFIWWLEDIIFIKIHRWYSIFSKTITLCKSVFYKKTQNPSGTMVFLLVSHHRTFITVALMSP